MTLDEIKSSPQAIKIYSSRLNLRKDNGSGYAALCPWHSDKNPSLKISNKDGKWLFQCFAGCGAGSVIDFVSKFCSVSVHEAIQIIEKELSWQTEKSEVEKTFRSVAPSEPKKVITLEQYAVCETALKNSPEGIKFLNSRGIEYETAARLHLGYRERLNFDPSSESTGWIALPCIRDGRIVSIEYRSIVGKVFKRQPGMTTFLFNSQNIDPLEPVFVTEGKFDAIVLEQNGFRAVSIPNSSTVITETEKDILKEASCIYLAGDNDFSGQTAMTRLWADLGENTYLLKWPNNWKDANEAFLKYKTISNSSKPYSLDFKDLIVHLMEVAKSQPMQNFFSLTEQMAAGNKLRLEDHPHRWHCPIPSVDSMIRVMPGGLIGITATNTGMGKTTFAMNCEIYEARKYGEVVINYSGELTPDEYSNIVAAHVLQKDRTQLQMLDYKLAAKKLGDIRFYTGYNPDLNTITPVLDLIEKAIKRFGATRVILDHIHYFCLNEANPVEAMASAQQRIKSMCQKYGVIFIELAQPRKAVQNLKGKMLHVTDIKGSEAVVSTSDAFLSIHREVARLPANGPPPKDPYDEDAIIQLLKGRSLGNGGSFTKLKCFGEWASFQEISPISESEQPGEKRFDEVL